jgi:hypothetical protein
LTFGEEGVAAGPGSTLVMTGATLCKNSPISFIVDAFGRSWRASLIAAP